MSTVANPTTAIPYFDYPGVFTAYEEEFVAALRRVGRCGAFIKQAELFDFERDLAGYLGTPHAIGVGNATDGLQIALMAAGLKAGDEVIFSSHTMVATAAAIHFANGIPVPVECGFDHLISPEAVEAAISSKTRALMPTQLNGRTADMDTLTAIASKHGLFLVEDAAQALGSRFKGKCAGTFGAASAISFYPAKLLGCLGDGGALVINDPAIFKNALELCDHGRDAQGQVARWGMNSRLDNLQAAFLTVQFRHYERVIERRRAIAARYRSHLSDVAEIGLPPGPDGDPDHFDVYQNYEITADQRDRLREYLKQNRIGTLIQWNGKAVHQCEALGFQLKLPYTEILFERMLMLPINMSITDSEVDRVAETIREFYGRK